MPRTKGSKNRAKSDIASQIAEKQSVIQTLTAEVEAIQKDIKEKKANLKIKKSGWKTHVFSLVNDMFTERQNDESSYKELASQHDMDAF